MQRAVRLSVLVSLHLGLVPALDGLALAGGKFPPTSVRCKDTGFKLQVDADGLTDVCVATSSPICQKGLSLKLDADGEADMCVAEGGTASKPTCPPKLDLKKQKGADACLATMGTHCPSGYRKTEVKGEDICMP